jgi:hypothetical protein
MPVKIKINKIVAVNELLLIPKNAILHKMIIH